ncbi:hypothetical protein RIF29_38513 [Crotalaria pallida]|uniref:Peptidase A1 domain-containing protein n=1 Tax=Crotalaria pallida TaxID=3830 RepID=A0AAN9DZG1_CROPI
MMMRRTQWSTITSQILIISLLLIPVIVNGLNNEENKKDHEEEGECLHHKARFELVHRHDVRFMNDDDDELDRAEVMKGFIYRDSLRRSMMNKRLGLDHSSSSSLRRKDYETIQMPLISGRDYGFGEYFVQVEVGTQPSQKLWLVADTGDEFTWFTCKDTPDTYTTGGVRHKHHHKRNHKKKSRSRSRSAHRSRSGSKTKRRTRTRTKKPDPCKGVFCPKRSETFQHVSCSSSKCMFDLSNLFSLATCPRPSDPCQYDISYYEGSSAQGYFGTDTITVDLANGKKGKLHNVTIGCTKSMKNSKKLIEKTGGILGIGYGKNSIIEKAAIQYGRGMFSYCLVDHLSHKDVSSYLSFGTQKVKLLGEMKKADLILVPPYYGMKVTGISVGGQMLKIPPHVWDFDAKGGVIIDSGTTMTSLVPEAYEPVFEALNKSLGNVKRVSGDFGESRLCFSSEGFNMSTVPRLAIHFVGGARLEPPVKSYIIDFAPEVKCLGIERIKGPGASVIGNIMQQNYLWEFDLAQYTVAFAPSTCT